MQRGTMGWTQEEVPRMSAVHTMQQVAAACSRAVPHLCRHAGMRPCIHACMCTCSSPVAGAVEAVAPDVVLLVQLVGQAVHVRVRGHGLVEGSVEHAHLRQATHRHVCESR